MGSRSKIEKLIRHLALKEQGGAWSKVKGSQRPKKSKSPATSISFLIAFLIKQLSWEHCNNAEVREIIASRKPRRSGPSSNLRIPHYWIQYYHNGYKGGFKKGTGPWLFFPRKNKNGKSARVDPRRPSKARNEIYKKDVKRFGKLSPGRAKQLKSMGAVWAWRRKGWRGDPFMDNAIMDFWRNVDQYLQEYVTDIMYLDFTAVAKNALNGRFGTTVRAESVSPEDAAILFHFYDPIFKEIRGQTDAYRMGKRTPKK